MVSPGAGNSNFLPAAVKSSDRLTLKTFVMNKRQEVLFRFISIFLPARTAKASVFRYFPVHRLRVTGNKDRAAIAAP
jgi:hypothetical protein